MKLTESQKEEIVLRFLLVGYNSRATIEEARKLLNTIRAFDDRPRDEKGHFISTKEKHNGKN